MEKISYKRFVYNVKEKKFTVQASFDNCNLDYFIKYFLECAKEFYPNFRYFIGMYKTYPYDDFKPDSLMEITDKNILTRI